MLNRLSIIFITLLISCNHREDIRIKDYIINATGLNFEKQNESFIISTYDNYENYCFIKMHINNKKAFEALNKDKFWSNKDLFKWSYYLPNKEKIMPINFINGIKYQGVSSQKNWSAYLDTINSILYVEYNYEDYGR